MTFRLLTVLVLLAACASAPRPLEYADVAIEGLAFEADSADAIERFGKPDSTRTLPRRMPAGGDGSSTVPILHYPGLALLFGEDGLLSGFDISAPPHRTVRGLVVGADSVTVERLYGPPRSQGALVWLYSSEDGLIEMALRIHDGRVTSITIGAVEFARAR